MFHAAYTYKQFWMKLGFNSDWASPVANRVVFKNTQVWAQSFLGYNKDVQPLSAMCTGIFVSVRWVSIGTGQPSGKQGGLQEHTLVRVKGSMLMHSAAALGACVRTQLSPVFWID
jgi:hypothetical protein